MLSWLRLKRVRAREDINLDDVCVLEVYRCGLCRVPFPGVGGEGQVAVCEAEETDGSLEAPDGDDGPDERIVFSFEDADVAAACQ